MTLSFIICRSGPSALLSTGFSHELPMFATKVAPANTRKSPCVLRASARKQDVKLQAPADWSVWQKILAAIVRSDLGFYS
jgi:hypothetical protein